MPPTRLTLRKLHANPKALAEFMGWNYEPRKGEHGLTVLTADEVVIEKWKDYVCWVNDGHPSRYIPQSCWSFKQECFRELGIKKGSHKYRVEAALIKFPNLYKEVGHA